MTPRRKQAITYLVASAPALWWGFSTFKYGGHDQGMAIAVSVACTFGILFALCGMVMLFTKKKLGVIEPMDNRVTAQVKVWEKDKIEETAIRMAPEQSELFVEKHIMSSEMIKSFRSLGDTVAQCTAERADLRATLNSRGISIEENGTIEVK